MLGRILVILCLLFSFLKTRAAQVEQTMPPWTKTSEISEKANTRKEFIKLQKKYPQYFSGYDPLHVKSAFIDIITWFYDAQSTCEKEDPRLTQQTISYGLCEEQNGNGQCFATDSALPSGDPCLDHGDR